MKRVCNLNEYGCISNVYSIMYDGCSVSLQTLIKVFHTSWNLYFMRVVYIYHVMKKPGNSLFGHMVPASPAAMNCCMHVVEVDGPISLFTDISWDKFIQSVFLWKDLACRESVVAEEAVQRFNLNSQESTAIPDNGGYHRDCYCHFTNKTKIQRAQKRREKEALLQENATKGWYQKMKH